MVKLSKEFKEETQLGFKQGHYVGRRIMLMIVLVVVTLAVLSAGLKFFGTNTDRLIFKSSVAYSEGTAQFLAKSYREFNAAESTADKRAIMEYVVMRYPNIPTTNIENQQLKQFYLMCLQGE